MPLSVEAAPSMVGKWSCENCDENNSVRGVVNYYLDGTSSGSFQARVVEGEVIAELNGTYQATWKQENTLLVETVTGVDVQKLSVNGQDFSNTPTEIEIERSMVTQGKTFSEIIDSSEVEVVLEDADGNISTCLLF